MQNEIPNHVPPIHCDALVVGAGFSGVSLLYRLRKLGLNAKIFEAGDDFGGTWYWNRYPGARVDSEWPYYQLSIPEVYKTWTFKERFPDHYELRSYFAHIDKVLNLRKDTYFNARVADCSWDDVAGEWTIKTEQGHVAKTRFLLIGAGVLHRPHVPDLPGLSDYRGRVCHSALWPEDLDLKGKRVALIGTGATGVQITQEVTKDVDHLTILMRRPSNCLPAMQRFISVTENRGWHPYMGHIFEMGRTTASGFLPTTKPAERTVDVPAEEREKFWDELWDQGASANLLHNYQDMLTDKEANKLVYEHWANKVRGRMTDEKKMQFMAPMPVEKMPYWVFTKRPPLEIDYYEMVDKPWVDVINIRETPSRKFNETGLEMEDGRQIDFDVLILATGFDAYKGELAHMGLKDRHGVDISDHWTPNLRSYLGMTCAGFPNVFMTYTRLSPAIFSNGTTAVEVQCDLAVAMIQKILHSEQDDQKIKSVEATLEAEDEWVADVRAQNEGTLFPLTTSWWNNNNNPGEGSEPLMYLKGLATYEQEAKERLEEWKGFDVRYWERDENLSDGTHSAKNNDRGARLSRGLKL